MRRRTLLLGAGLACRAAWVPADEAPQGLPIGLGYFGMHFHRLVVAPGDRARPTAWPPGVVGSLRLWDSGTRWGDIAPAPGQWVFDRMDAYVDAAAAQGASVLCTLGSTPRWASARPDEPGPYGPGCAAEPVRLAHWEEYVGRVATRYRGRIAAYELWNEPQFSDFARDRGRPGFFSGSVAQMVELARAARRVLDRVDPSARLATPGFVNGPDRLDLFLSSGGAELVQAVAYHCYAGGSRQFIDQVAEVRQIMRRRGVAGLPFWNTECGVETYAPSEALPEGVARLGEAEAAARTAQFLILGAALGLERFYYYAWDNGHSGLVDADGEPTLRMAALRRVEQWLLGARLSPPEALGRSGVRVRGQRDGRPFLLVWADGGAVRAPIPRGWAPARQEALLPATHADPALSGAPLLLELAPLGAKEEDR
jgi:hypothetical protein